MCLKMPNDPSLAYWALFLLFFSVYVRVRTRVRACVCACAQPSVRAYMRVCTGAHSGYDSLTESA